MAADVNPEERRAYREGVVDQKLEGHDRHFAEINGSVDKLAEAVVEVEKTLSRVADQVQGLVVTMPSLQRLTAETATAAEIADKVAAAITQKNDDDKQEEQEKLSTWKRYREIAAWSLGILVAAVTIANFGTRVLGVAVKSPPTQTVTEITSP